MHYWRLKHGAILGKYEEAPRKATLYLERDPVSGFTFLHVDPVDGTPFMVSWDTQGFNIEETEFRENIEPLPESVERFLREAERRTGPTPGD